MDNKNGLRVVEGGTEILRKRGRTEQQGGALRYMEMEVDWATGSIYLQRFHQSKQSRFEVRLGAAESHRIIGLDRTTDLLSWTGQAWSGPVQGTYFRSIQAS